mmetsp:Transcript_79537/g.247023  ORF Transcript_79537/g.247023 Transcript_79537/m.247023 type:complete len:746 (-) Transcript_79537:79-2316(-)
MTCPYCLAFSSQGARRPYKSRKTLVRAYWEFEEEAKGWMGFSPAVSGLLEASFDNWMADPQLKKMPQVRSGMFLYTVDFASMTEEQSMGKYQRIRRVGVASNETTEGSGMCTLHPKVYKDFQAERDSLRKERDGLRKELEQLQQERSQEADEHTRQMAELDKQLLELRRHCDEQQAELEQARRMLAQEQEAAVQLQRHLAGAYPGCLVTLEATPRAAVAAAVPPGTLGRVRALEGPAAVVDFPGKHGVWLPCTSLRPALEAQLLTCPGTRVVWRGEGGSWERGVVCDAVDALTVHVLGTDGKKQARRLQGLAVDKGPRPAESPLEPGDLVRVRGKRAMEWLSECGVATEDVGMVLSSSDQDIRVRFRTELAEEGDGIGDSHVDLNVASLQAELQRNEADDRVRPGAAVRFREPLPEVAVPGQSVIGIVYATHGDGTSVVDFFGNLGCRCNVSRLEVVEPPSTAAHAVLRALSECLAWHEVCAQQSEEREEDGVLRLMSTLPSIAVPLKCTAPEYSVVDWDRQTGLFQFVARTLLASPRGQAEPGSARTWGEPPQLCVQRVQGLCNPTLQQAYELALQRCRAMHPDGCTGLQDNGLLRVLGTGVECNEAFLWHLAPADALERICHEGLRAQRGGQPAAGARGTGLFCAETASGAELDVVAEGDVGDPKSDRCLLLVRVLLGVSRETTDEALWDAQWSCAEDGTQPCDSICVVRRAGGSAADYRGHVVRCSAQALPLFRVFYRHEVD